MVAKKSHGPYKGTVKKVAKKKAQKRVPVPELKVNIPEPPNHATAQLIAEEVARQVRMALGHQDNVLYFRGEPEIPMASERERSAREQAQMLKDNSVLRKAEEIIYGDREKTYGRPDFNLDSIGQLWTVYLQRRFVDSQPIVLNIADVCQLMILLKTARLINNPGHRDSVVDQCGYAALHDRCWQPF